MSFELWVPFRLQPQYQSSTTSVVTAPVGDRNIKLQTKNSLYNLRIDGLVDQAESERWLPRAFAGLTSLMLETKSAYTASWNLTEAIEVSRSPSQASSQPLMAFDAIGDDEKPFVVPSGQRVGIFTGLQPTVTMTTSLQLAADAIVKGMATPHAEDLFNDQRFRTGVELFAAAAFERSLNARLLSYAMALEVLAPPTPRHVAVLRLIDKWSTEVDAVVTELPRESEEFHALDSLKNEVLVRKETSIRRRIRHLILTTLGDRADVTTLAKAADTGYKKRSTLSHTGLLPASEAGEAVEALRHILELVIQTRLFGQHRGG